MRLKRNPKLPRLATVAVGDSKARAENDLARVQEAMVVTPQIIP